MPPLAIALALTSAFIHASWNAALKSGRDRLTDSFLIGVGGIAPALLMIALMGLPPDRAWPYLIASSCVHVIYWTVLMKGYDAGDLSHVYTLSRGTAPVLVAVGAAFAAREIPSPVDMVGIGLVSAGVMSIGLSPHAPLRATLWALAIGVCIAGYSLIDALGARAAGNAAVYIGWDVLMASILLVLFALVRRGVRVIADARVSPWRGLAVGVISMLGYGIVLWAQTLAPIAQVTALRETSVVFAVLIAAFVLREKVEPRRWLGAALAVGGGLLIAFG